MTADERTPIIEPTRRNSEGTAQLFYFSQAGACLVSVLLLFFLWAHRYSLFLWHPTLMVLFLFFLTQAILALQYPSPRASPIRRHQLFQVAGLVSLGAGLLVMDRLKRAGGEARFQSAHGKLGLGIAVAALLAAAVGATKRHFPQLYGSYAPRVLVPHRYLGYLIYLLVLLNVALGLELAFGFHALALSLAVYTTMAFAGLAMLGGISLRKMRWGVDQSSAQS